MRSNWIPAATAFCLFAVDAHAQSALRSETDVRLERAIALADPAAAMANETDGDDFDSLAFSGARPAILLTGYWPPTNEMLRRFSPDPAKNPLGWIGADWEGRGYDVYSIFPEFEEAGCGDCGKGVGDLTVDYQDTVADFAAITAAIRPIGIVTFSRGLSTWWEIEMNQYNRAFWIDDYCAPFRPTPSPPDASVPAGFLRRSTLPVTAIRDAVNAAALGVYAIICESGDGGGFLSEFVAYQGVSYQAAHAHPDDPARCVAAGHVHVGGRIPAATAALATDITLRKVIEHIDSFFPDSTLVAYGAGSVNAACGPNETVLLVNGDDGGAERTVRLGVGAPLSLSIREATSRAGDGRASKLTVYGWICEPGRTDGVVLPFGHGRMCFGLGASATRLPDRIWSSLGKSSTLGAHDAPNIAFPRIPDGGSLVLFSRPLGIAKPVDLTFQGLIEDECGVGTSLYSVTNAVMARIEDAAID